MNNLDMKECPFCGGKAELQTHKWRNLNIGYECTHYDYYLGVCTSCEARGKSVVPNKFNEFSGHTTVQQFKDDHALRSRIEEEYKVHLEEKKQEAIDAWNFRYTS